MKRKLALGFCILLVVVFISQAFAVCPGEAKPPDRTRCFTCGLTALYVTHTVTGYWVGAETVNGVHYHVTRLKWKARYRCGMNHKKDTWLVGETIIKCVDEDWPGKRK